MKLPDGIEQRFRQWTPLVLLGVVAVALFEPWLPGREWLRERFGDAFLLRACLAALGVHVLLLWGEALRLHGILTGVLQAFREFSGERARSPGSNPKARLEAARLLIAALRSDDASIRATSRHNLTRLVGEDLGDDPERWQQWLDRQ